MFIDRSMWLGNVTSKALGIYIIGRALKCVMDSIIHSRQFEIYGYGWQLLTAFWDSLTNFLSNRSHSKQQSMKKDKIT